MTTQSHWSKPFLSWLCGLLPIYVFALFACFVVSNIIFLSICRNPFGLVKFANEARCKCRFPSIVFTYNSNYCQLANRVARQSTCVSIHCFKSCLLSFPFISSFERTICIKIFANKMFFLFYAKCACVRTLFIYR